jgi:hypothetical protein
MLDEKWTCEGATYALDDVWDLGKGGLLCDLGLHGEEGGLVELEAGWVVVDVGGGVGRDREGDVDVVDLVVEVGLGRP